MRNNQTFPVTFTFSLVKENEMEKLFQNLVKIFFLKNQNLLRLLKKNINIFKKVSTSSFNEAISLSQFPSTITLVDIKPVFNMDHKNLKSALCFLHHNLSKPEYGITKGFSIQNCLYVMIEKWKKSVDQKRIFGVLTDFSKAFICIPEQLLITKVSPHIFDFEALEFIYSNINSRKQRGRKNKSFNEWVVAFQLLFIKTFCKASLKFYYQLYHFNGLHFQRKISIYFSNGNFVEK